MSKRHGRVFAVLLSVLAVFATQGCRRGDARGDPHARTRATNDLISLCLYIHIIQSDVGKPPPASLQLLVPWLEKHGGHWSMIDSADKTIKDRWGNPIIVVSQDGKFVGVCSPGQNGVWEGGRGDDIFVRLEDVIAWNRSRGTLGESGQTVYPGAVPPEKFIRLTSRKLGAAVIDRE